MWTLDDIAMFGNRPCVVRRGPARLRHAAQPPAHGEGASVVPQGREATEVTQEGRLVEDDRASLGAVLDVMRLRLDGRPRTLASTDGQRFEHLVMLEVDHGAVTRLGPRWTTTFRIRYAEVSP